MDVSGITGMGEPLNGFAMGALPLGFGTELAIGEFVGDGFSNMTETDREHIIMQCKDARSKEEMQRILDSAVPGGNLSDVMDHNEGRTL